MFFGRTSTLQLHSSDTRWQRSNLRYFGFTFVQQEEVETRHPSLFNKHEPSHELNSVRCPAPDDPPPPKGPRSPSTASSTCRSPSHKLMEQNYNFCFIFCRIKYFFKLPRVVKVKSINSATRSSDGCFELKRRVWLTDHFNKMTLPLHICTC